MIRTVCVAMLVVAGTVNSASGATRFVKANAVGANNGTSWANAYTSLQSALAAAVAGDEIWVAAGTYKPATPATPNPRTLSFNMKSGVKVLGGFFGSETASSQRNPRFNVCVLSGDINGDDLPGFVNREDNSNNVVKANNIASVGVLDGFTISGGNANGAGNESFGGGVDITGGGTPIVSNCVIRDNLAGAGAGAGVALVATAARITQCVITGNQAQTASAVDVQSNSPASILHCSITHNQSAQSSGTAVRFLNTTGGTVRGCVLWGNSNSVGSSQVAQINLVNAGTTNVTDCDVQGGVVGLGAACFSLDPLLISPLGNDGIAGTGDEDLRIKPGSPCIDRVPASSLPADTTDMDGDANTAEAMPLDLRWQTRARDDIAISNPLQAIVDIGAYEFQGISCAGDMDGNGTVNTNDLTRFLAVFGDSGEPLRAGDFNADGLVNTADLVMFLANFGVTCAV